MADAYRNYEFYLPAFLDFRGRIYRAGVLHFHERDISKSLILFSKTEEEYYSGGNSSKKNQLLLQLYATAAFKYQKFTSYKAACEWYNQHKDRFQDDSTLISFASNASDSFQFMSKVVSFRKADLSTLMYCLPVSQDASASAYQIMSYFLLNQEMARLTNLLPSQENVIQDIYQALLSELREYLLCEYKKMDEQEKSNLNVQVFNIINAKLNRKLVKSIFMPMLYGKTVTSIGNDLYSLQCYSQK